MNPKRKGIPTCRCITLEGPVSELTCTKSDIFIRYKLQKAKLEATVAQKNAQANLDFIKEELNDISKDIQALKGTIQALESSSEDLNANPRQFSSVSRVKSSLKVDLTNLLRQECSIKRQLFIARIACRNARIDEVLIAEKIKHFNEQCWEEHCLHKANSAEHRLAREEVSRRNAKFVREATITSVANSITSHVLHKLPGEHNVSTKQIKKAKRAKRIIDHFIAKSFEKTRERKVIEATEHQLRHRRQAQNLLKLKQDFTEIKKDLKRQIAAKKAEKEKVTLEKEEVKTLLMARGTNPYLADYLFALEEKQRAMQRKMIIDEKRKYSEMHRELSIVESSKSKEESERQKWDKVWAQKAKQKSMKQKQEQKELYYGKSSISSKKSGKESAKTESKKSKDSNRFSNTSDGGQNKEALNHEDKQSASNHSNKKSVTANSEKSAPTNIEESKLDRKSDATSTSTGKTSEQEKGPQVETLLDQPLAIRKAIHLDLQQKQSLLNMADENSKAVLMNRGQNSFDFGPIRVGERKYIAINIANIGPESVKLKMSALDPYGSISICNALRKIPSDSYFSLKFKYQPTAPGKDYEIIKLEEANNHENFILIQLHGKATPNSA